MRERRRGGTRNVEKATQDPDATGTLYGKTTDELLRFLIYALAGMGGFVLLYRQEIRLGRLDYNNATHTRRFVLLFAALFALAFVLPFTPIDVWPYVVVFVILGLFSNMTVGLYGGAYLLLLSVYLTADNANAVTFMYLIAGMVALTLFRDLDEGFKVAQPMFITLAVLFVLLCGYHLLYLSQELTLTILFFPVLNVFATLILLSVVLNIFGIHVVRRSNDMYMEINDPEYKLMTALKEHDKEAYFTAIHTAYLAERIALDLDMDARAVKACAYYHSVCKELAEDGDAAAFAAKEHFPEDAVRLIGEYTTSGKYGFSTREAAAINICETLVKMLKSIFNKDKTAKVDYDAMIDKIFEHHWQHGDLNMNNVTFGDMTRIKQLLKKETLYYDFLR